ncbi:hypothetical protein LIER_24863 [Lithospermum erythrorhizon]|uniref:Uncharacterized protein n=1 Tax=Lithospermum erythrorhizon TaxID=34254 RepID=A0AAV3R5P8_LITER
MANLAYPFCYMIIFYSLVSIVQCWPAGSNPSYGLISNEIVVTKNVHGLSSSDECVHAYGFFPCADSVWGYIYQIVVIQYLMSHGEKLMTLASTKIFTSLGTGIYGAIIFRILMALPTLMILSSFIGFAVSGILSNNEAAQSQVPFGISVSAGSTIFNLTVLWGINLTIFIFVDTGVKIDQHTSEAANFMFLSSLPFALMQLTNLGIRFTVIGFSLLFSFMLLFFYFRYQVAYLYISYNNETIFLIEGV